MNYELAIQLKNAGFPQETKLGSGYWADGMLYFISSEDYVNPENGFPLKCPILSELIQACGKIGVKISHHEDGRVYAIFDKDDGHGNLLDFCMDSLEEIYANLWLELNK